MKRTRFVAYGPIVLTGLVLALRVSAQAFPLPAQQQTLPPAQPAPPAPAPTLAPAPQAAPPAAAPTSSPPPAAQPVPPPPAAEPVWIGAVSAPPVAAPNAPPAVCTPACGPGMVCAAGRCLSACYPPCRGREYCVDPGVCRAPPVAPKPGARQHDGFLVRAAGGLLSANLRAGSQTPTRDLTDHTLTGLASVDVGQAVAEDLIVRLRLQGSIGFFTDSSFGGDVVPVFGGIGGGADYYFMPINVYVGGTVSLVGVSTSQINNLDQPPSERNNHVRRSGPGVGLDFDLGKEWWITGNWGFGAALRFRYLNMAPENVGLGREGRLTSVQGGLMFSATYN